MYKIKINTHPCGLCRKLESLVPKLESLFPGVAIELVKEAVPGVTGYPRTAVVFTDCDGKEYEEGVLYGFRSELQHVSFLIAILEEPQTCAIS